MIDDNGIEWLTYSEAAERVGIQAGTLRVWVARRKVRAHRIGRVAYAHMGDVRHASRNMQRVVVAV